MKRPTPNYKEMFQNLNAAMDEVFKEDIEEQKAVLRELGHDPDEVLRRGEEQMVKLRARVKRKIKAKRRGAFFHWKKKRTK